MTANAPATRGTASGATIDDMSQAELRAEADRLYETFVRPYEPNRWGEFVAVAPDGTVVFAASYRDVIRLATETLGGGNFVFKIGERAVGTIR